MTGVRALEHWRPLRKLPPILALRPPTQGLARLRAGSPHRRSAISQRLAATSPSARAAGIIAIRASRALKRALRHAQRVRAITSTALFLISDPALRLTPRPWALR